MIHCLCRGWHRLCQDKHCNHGSRTHQGMDCLVRQHDPEPAPADDSPVPYLRNWSTFLNAAGRATYMCSTCCTSAYRMGGAQSDVVHQTGPHGCNKPATGTFATPTCRQCTQISIPGIMAPPMLGMQAIDTMLAQAAINKNAAQGCVSVSPAWQLREASGSIDWDAFAGARHALQSLRPALTPTSMLNVRKRLATSPLWHPTWCAQCTQCEHAA